MSTWFYYDNEGHKQGPITGGQLKGLAKAGQITPGTMLETEDGKATPARKVQGLTFVTIPPTTTETVQPSTQSVPEPTAPIWESTSTVEPTPEIKPKRKKHIGKVALLLLIVVGLLIAYINRDKIANFAPGLGESMTGYRRGFGDTILTYKNRSYEGAAWQEVSISQLNDNVRLYRVLGWEDDDYWVATYAGVVRYKNGTWIIPYRFNKDNDERFQRVSLLDKDTLFIGLYQERKGIFSHLIREDGVHFFRQQSRDATTDKARQTPGGWSNYLYAGMVYYADNGLLYITLWDENFFNRTFEKVTFSDLKTLGDTATTYHRITREDKEYSILTRDNTATGNTIANLRRIIQIAPGKGIGVAGGHLAEFRNGIWYEIEGSNSLGVLWLDCSGTTPNNAVSVGKEGRIIIHQFGGGNREMQVPQPQETTSMELFRVWGNSIDKLWTMDTNGTVWEKDGNNWRVVVRGLRKDNVEFIDAWVSPTGAVFAITEDKLYQLK